MNDDQTYATSNTLRGPTMRTFNHDVAYTAVRTVVEQVAADGKRRVVRGTGFFYLAEFTDDKGKPRKRLLLISNRHVLGGGRGKMTLNLNRRKDDGTPDHGNTISLVYEGDDLARNYYAHPQDDVDLACVNVSRVTRTDAYTAYIEQDQLTPIDPSKVAPGSQVLFAGFPNDYYDTVNNLPLVRGGILASLPVVDFRGRPYVAIEALAFEGSSGSPVFVKQSRKYRFLGVLSRTKEGVTPSGSKTMLGFGFVIKQRLVQELVDDASKAAVERMRKDREA